MHTTHGTVRRKKIASSEIYAIRKRFARCLCILCNISVTNHTANLDGTARGNATHNISGAHLSFNRNEVHRLWKKSIYYHLEHAVRSLSHYAVRVSMKRQA